MDAKVVLSGYYGCGNLGDEAVLAGLLRAFRRLEPGARVVVLSADPGRTARLHGVAAEPRGLRGAWRALAGARVLVSGGGSLLQDVTSARSPLYYLGIMALARLRGARVVWAAQGIGPVRRRWIRWLVGREARRAWAITVRDEASRQSLARWSRLDPGRIEVVPDPAWALAELADQRRALPAMASAPAVQGAGDERRLRPRPDALHVAVAWRDWPGQPVPAREAGRALGLALAELLPAGSRVTVMALQPGQDLEPCRELARFLHGELSRHGAGANREVAVEPAPEDPAEAVRALGQFDLVVGVRLHALILAGAAGVPFVGVGYDPKVEGLLAQLRWPLQAIHPGEVADPAAWRARLAEALNRREVLRARLAEVREVMAREAVAALRPVAALLGAGPRDARCPAPVEVLGLPVHPVSLDEAADILAGWLEEAPEPSRTRHVITLNPEMVMRARADPAFASVIGGADLVVPDGVGVVWAARILGHAMKGRVPGIELAERALATCARRRLPVFLLGGAPPGPHGPGAAEAAAERLRQRSDMAGLVVAGTHHGYFAWGSDEEERLLQRIEAARPALLLVGMGAPRQEHFIARHRDRLGRSVRVAIGVGGSLDVWAGRTRRAPALVRHLALEWLYRVATEPRRLRRLAALPAFAAAVMTVRLGGIMGQRPRHRT